MEAVFSMWFMSRLYGEAGCVAESLYDYVTKSCRQHIQVRQNHENEHVRGIGQGQARN
jgi:hypothetical protein